jgi:hypothetical protein
MVINRDVVKWVLENYYELSHGIWPDPEVDENSRMRKQLSHHASYENPCGVAGDVSARVRLCGRDGIITEKCYGIDGGMPLRPGALSRKYHLKFEDVTNALNRVTWFCTDEEYGKGVKYGEWKRDVHGHRKYRQPTAIKS